MVETVGFSGFLPPCRGVISRQVDDHVVIHEGLKRVLEDEFKGAVSLRSLRRLLT